MNTSGAMQPSAESAAAALRGARAAQTAARRPQAVPGWYPATHGLLLAAGFTGFGAARMWPQWQGWFLAAAMLCSVGFLAVTWIMMRSAGIAPWFDRREQRASWRSWGAPLVPFVAGLLLAIPYGTAGWFVGFGVVAGAGAWVGAARRRARALESS
ncbi:hypothetical protein [Streptomyces peucetius]|uniref:Uncharacterized protein n=1 Tax=Streptomyces peucetius TaxID=1950 RepID=A0ABY6IEN2_STRPE|nr:hypothetical protein [Streptomyces peucetius]UYQ64180.1 hypothetical protein OGH68_23740 [Streptomyces peucetius]